MSPAGNITLLLRNFREGDRAAGEELFTQVYSELRKIAGSYLRRQAAHHTLQPTALLHEAYVKLCCAKRAEFRDRFHFYAATAAAMRHILVDHARAKHSEKRGGWLTPVPLNPELTAAGDCDAAVLALDDALASLATLDERKARVLELRYFGGLSIEDTAEALEISPATVGRETRFAEAWLRRELGAPRLSA